VTEAHDGVTAAGDRAEDAAGSTATWPPGAAVPAVYCPFLSSIDLDDRVGRARLAPDTANRCLSTGEPVAPSAHDQRALCLTPDHPACARFVAATRRTREPEPAAAAGRRLSAPILAAVAVLVVAAVAAGASLAVNGDLSIGVAPSPSPAATLPASSPMAAATAAPRPAPTAVPSLPPSPTATPAPSASPTPDADVAAATSEPVTPSPRPRRYPGLTACPNAADCYIYVVKSGDTLGAIAGRYGFTLDEVLERNPSIRDPGLIVRGQEIRLPTPKG
jgi:hypothetical protein